MVLKAGKEEKYMCNGNFFGNGSNCWIIILVILLLICGCGGNNDCGCGCGCQ